MWWYLMIPLLAIILGLFLQGKQFQRQIKDEVRRMQGLTQSLPSGPITEKDLASLPPPLQRYLRYAGVIGKEREALVQFHQTGLFRTAPDQSWLNFKAQEYFSADPPMFLWDAQLGKKGLNLLHVRDLYQQGKGSMLVKILNVFTIVDAKGPKLDQGALLRYLSELVWFPTAFLSPYIRYKMLDESRIQATLSYQDQQVSGVFEIDPTGKICSFTASRYHDGSGQFESWFTPMEEYAEVGGFMIPVKARAIWQLEAGDFCYVRIEAMER